MKKTETNEEILEKTKKAQFLEILKFTAFSLSAGVIQILSFELLYNWINWHVWWPTYLISITLSVVWNFTFNRKFTFKSANNVPISMILAFLFYVAFVPASVFGGNALKAAGWDGTLVTVLMMVINFVLEFLWQKFLVFNDKVVKKFVRNKKEEEV